MNIRRARGSLCGRRRERAHSDEAKIERRREKRLKRASVQVFVTMNVLEVSNAGRKDVTRARP